MGFKPRRGQFPVCVYWDNRKDGEKGWCICKEKPKADMFNQATKCGQSVTLPGRFELCRPTCPECLELLEKGLVPASIYPRDLREFLPCA